MAMRQLTGAIVGFCLLGAAAWAQSQVVKVTVPRANVRSEPSEKAPVIQQVTPRDQIEWRATEGDWFRVLLPPNPALGGARVEAYISKKVSKLEATPVMSASEKAAADASAERSSAPAIDTHAANVFLGTGADGQLLKAATVTIAPNGNRQVWTIEKSGEWTAAADRRPSFVVSIGDRAQFSPAGLAPSVVRLAAPSSGLAGQVIGSSRGDRDWKADEVSLEMTEGASGVWTVKPSKDLKPGDYAIVMRPLNSKAAMPEIAWAFTIK